MKREIKFRGWHKTDLVMDYDPGNGNDYETINETIRDDNYELMQYTGLKDKNGKDIYEGDVLKHDLWGNSQIIWEHGMFRGIGNEHDITLADHQLKRSRVIGNIYENPELLPPKTDVRGDNEN